MLINSDAADLFSLKSCLLFIFFKLDSFYYFDFGLEISVFVNIYRIVLISFISYIYSTLYNLKSIRCSFSCINTIYHVTFLYNIIFLIIFIKNIYVVFFFISIDFPYD